MAKLVEVLFVLQPSIQPKTEQVNNELLMSDVAINNLVPSLMKFYTGMTAENTLCYYWKLWTMTTCNIIEKLKTAIVKKKKKENKQYIFCEK